MGCGWNCNPPESDKCGLPLASKHGSKFPKSHLVCHLVWARKTVATNCLHPWGQCFAPTIWLWRVTPVKLGARGVASQLPEMVTKQSSKVEYLPITLKFWDSFSFTCQAAAVNSAGHTGHMELSSPADEVQGDSVQVWCLDWIKRLWRLLA